MGTDNWQEVTNRKHRRTNNDVFKISKLVYMTNFLEYTSARDLWKTCSVYGTVVDVFILSKTSKAAGSKSRPPMLNKENYVPWSSRLLRYPKSRPNGKLIHNSILNGLYVRRMIAEPGDGKRDVNVNETFHEKTDDELSERELKQIEADH
nr:ribonuclease H-like domain-containing protein [Tanacetum cinerariifolium]